MRGSWFKDEGPLAAQCVGQGSVASPLGGGDQRQVQHIALGVAAAEARRLAAHCAQQLGRLGMAT